MLIWFTDYVADVIPLICKQHSYSIPSYKPHWMTASFEGFSARECEITEWEVLQLHKGTTCWTHLVFYFSKRQKIHIFPHAHKLHPLSTNPKSHQTEAFYFLKHLKPAALYRFSFTYKMLLTPPTPLALRLNLLCSHYSFILVLPLPRGLCFCWFLVCLSVNNLTRQVIDGFWWHFQDSSAMTPGTID